MAMTSAVSLDGMFLVRNFNDHPGWIRSGIITASDTLRLFVVEATWGGLSVPRAEYALEDTRPQDV